MLPRLLAVVCAIIHAPHAVSSGHLNEQNAQPVEEIPWPIRLGMRAHTVDQAFPLVDRVVLVPDAATYVDEISKWSPAGRWPVLIEDDRYTPMFIRRFAPAEVIRREAAGQWPDEQSAREKLLEELLVRIWGGDPSRQTLEQTFASHSFEPAGIVIASVNDPAWTAAVALAAGRGQPLAWADDRYGRPNAAIDREAADALSARIKAALEAQSWPFRRLGDAIDTVTLCRSVAGRVNLPHPDTGQAEPAALTDVLGRHADGTRYAIVGWVYGDEVRSAYIAMCSLFLPRDTMALVNTYPNDGQWVHWSMTGPSGLLAQRGFDVRTYSGEAAGEREWLRLISDGLDVDILLMNTRGNVDFFHLADDVRATAFDVPTLNHPTVVHLTHSWSMRSPESETTIAGRLIDGGAYAYVGSVHEPFLQAFVQPLPLAERLTKFVPVLVAARHWEGPQPFGGPWKINTFGDPLMVTVPAATNTRERIESNADYGERLNDAVRESMRRIDQDESGEAIAESIALLELLGRDEIAVQLWRLAVQRGLTAQAAGPALGPLFRRGEAEEYLAAWQESGRRDDTAIDMLWHKLTPMLGIIHEEETLMQLLAVIRRPHVQGDLGRLAPHLSRALGRDHVRSIVEREIDRAANRRVERALRQLLSGL